MSEAKLRFNAITFKDTNKLTITSNKFNPFFKTNSVRGKLSKSIVVKKAPEKPKVQEIKTETRGNLPKVFKNSSRFAQIRRKLVQFLNMLKKLKLTPREVEFFNYSF